MMARFLIIRWKVTPINLFMVRYTQSLDQTYKWSLLHSDFIKTLYPFIMLFMMVYLVPGYPDYGVLWQSRYLVLEGQNLEVNICEKTLTLSITTFFLETILANRIKKQLEFEPWISKKKIIYKFPTLPPQGEVSELAKISYFFMFLFYSLGKRFQDFFNGKEKLGVNKVEKTSINKSFLPF